MYFYISIIYKESPKPAFPFYYVCQHLEKGVSCSFVNRDSALVCCLGWAQQGEECTIRE